MRTFVFSFIIVALASSCSTTFRGERRITSASGQVLCGMHHVPLRSATVYGLEPGNIVEVTYKGIVPDTFKDEAEVVLKGKLSPDGFHVDPNGVMAKCPSKYEVKDSPLAGKSGA